MSHYFINARDNIARGVCIWKKNTSVSLFYLNCIKSLIYFIFICLDVTSSFRDTKKDYGSKVYCHGIIQKTTCFMKSHRIVRCHVSLEKCFKIPTNTPFFPGIKNGPSKIIIMLLLSLVVLELKFLFEE